MRRTSSLWLALLLAGCAAATAAPAPAKPEKAKPPEDFGETGLGGGLSAGFGLLRVGGDAPQESLPLGGHVVTEPSNAVARLLVDENGETAFGYRLEAVPLSSTLHGVVRVDIKPLRPDDERKLKQLASCPTCPPPRLVPSGSIHFPPTQIVRDGDTMIIDLLVRPDTGEKIVDVVTFSSEVVTREALDEVRERVTRAFRHARQADELAGRAAWEAAAAEYAKAVALRPDAALHQRLGGCYLRLERLVPAQQQFEKAVRLNAEDADAWHGLGVAQHRLGRFGKAVDAYQRALKVRPEWSLARRNLASAQLDRAELLPAIGNYRDAYRASATILETADPASVKVRDAGLQHYIFARVYAAEGKPDLALASLKKAKDAGFSDLERVKEDPEFQPLLGDPRLVGLLAREPRS
jgi:tetratricopeptide (TPR) repeat protein